AIKKMKKRKYNIVILAACLSIAAPLSAKVVTMAATTAAATAEEEQSQTGTGQTTADNSDGEEDNNDVEDLPFYREFEYSVVVHLRAISKDYYQYQKSFDLYVENDGNPFAEPTLVKTNVKNGLGILGTASEVTDTIKFTIKNPYLEEEEE
ncbi:MAG: DUF4249 family protein, partial [Bacteroidales bacterium]|nr:DUF4249 family protein [Bacteroidales bacterium]